MPEPANQDIEEGQRGNGPVPQLTSNQSSQGRSQGRLNFGDSSGPLFSIYSKAADEEDNKMVERWQKDADGILIFTGLFSAAVAALLAVTVQDLRPNSQDISAFYLANIYQLLADPNVTRSSIPSPDAIPPRFTPPRYAVWVNSLWFLSLVMGLTCALFATSLHQWARRYLRMAQPARCPPEKRARMRAFFANGVEKMHVPWAVEGLPTLLHLSLFLFFLGLAIFLFNVDHEVFISVVWWIGSFSMVYGLITLLPIIRHDSPYNSPLSTPVWFLYARIRYVTFLIIDSIAPRFWTWVRFNLLRDRYQGWMLGGVEKAAEDTASERSSEIDVQIMDWTISALGDDDSLKSFFEAIPGFFNSKLVKDPQNGFPMGLLKNTLDGFLDRALSSNSVGDSEKLRRLDIAMNAMSLIHPNSVVLILVDILEDRWNELPQTVETGLTLARWSTNSDQCVAQCAREIVVGTLVCVRERNNSWARLLARVLDLPEQDLLDDLALGGDSVLLAVLIRRTRQYLCSNLVNRIHFDGPVLDELSKFDVHSTIPRLQHDFCTLWNEIVQEARNRGYHSVPTSILRCIHPLYVTLHQGTDAALTAFTASTPWFSDILDEPSSYPFCNLSSHRPDSTSHPTLPGNSPDLLSRSPTDDSNTASRQAEQVNNIIELLSPSNLTITSEIRATSHDPDMTPPTNPVPSSSHLAGASPTTVVAAALQDVTSTATLSHTLNGRDQQDSDTVVTSAQPGTGQILSAASTRATPSNSSHFIPTSIHPSIPASRPSNSTTFPCLRARGPANTRNTCFVNVVLQILVNLPPFWYLFRELGDLKRQRGSGVLETGGGATPLVDATVRFFKEFIVESPSTQQQSQPATGGKSRAGEEKKDDSIEGSFEAGYMYDAMKEKKQLKPLFDGQQQDAEEFLSLYLDALDEELLPLLASIGSRQSPSAALEADEHGVSQPGETEVGIPGQGFMVNFVESPITRMFGGKYRSLVRVPNQPDLVLTEDWRSLHLDIQPDSIRTVQDALMSVSQSQVRASGLGNANQQVLIEVPPPVLVLHLDRFRYDAAAGGIMKIRKPIYFTPELEIPLDIMVPDAQRPSEPPLYKLFGVLYHHGESVGGGHYTVDVLHPNGDGEAGGVWLHIDDEAVSPMRHEDVFWMHDAERVIDERCTYILFYCRTSPMHTS